MDATIIDETSVELDEEFYIDETAIDGMEEDADFDWISDDELQQLIKEVVGDE